jgi:hypothetical protein
LYAGESGQRTVLTTVAPPVTTTVEKDADLAGGNLLGRWQHVFSTTSDLTLQLYYDRTYRREPIFRASRDTFDLDWQHRVRLPWQLVIESALGQGTTMRLLLPLAQGDGELYTQPAEVEERTAAYFGHKGVSTIGLTVSYS